VICDGWNETAVHKSSNIHHSEGVVKLLWFLLSKNESQPKADDVEDVPVLCIYVYAMRYEELSSSCFAGLVCRV
jgi:hypothetical protein